MQQWAGAIDYPNPPAFDDPTGLDGQSLSELATQLAADAATLLATATPAQQQRITECLQDATATP